ncbi:MAG: tRNA (N6-isopentenyl adenosine(37)-C2)-methylthiotransferase MiaB [Chloroflexi bacterium]|nr:tRNA (N6-isopentenyl adenosine(37)-C2)-methylthiotransferase MiaB [Chloroflexota bacterium]MBT5628182.1 tRNA (N6-isopentenyl adenosine(37)-C2)-methylthiotransferase MiaB [Chloroflexota bacterium]
MPSYHVWTVGCQMNESDSERLSSGFTNMGFDATDDMATADVVVMNTCVVRQSAEDTATGVLGRLGKRMKGNPNRMIAVMGCMVGPEQTELKRRFPYVDVWARPQEFDPILETAGLKHGLDPEGCLVGAVSENPNVASFIPIVHGCDKFCTFCIIPYRRGRENSRPALEIVHEAEVMVARGVKDITLLGQNVDSYGHDIRPRVDLADLMEQVHEIPGLDRIRFLTSHPNDMSVRIIEAIRDLPKVCEMINLPFQAGDDTILANMRRGYTRGQFMDKIYQIKKMIPNVTLTTDLIVGFSGETDAQFERSMEILREVEFSKVHTSEYSYREGTFASRKMTDDVSRAVKKARKVAVDEFQAEIQSKNNATLVGTNLDVLVEGRKRGRLHGRSRGDKLIYLNVPVGTGAVEPQPGQTVQVEIKASSPWSLEAEPIEAKVQKEKVPVV